MGFRLLHYVLLRRKLVLSVTAVFFLFSLFYSIFVGRMYETRALLLPPQQEGGEGMLSAYMAQLNLPSMVLPTAVGTASAAVLVDILESRRLAEMIINAFDLRNRYGVSTMDDAVKQLRAQTAVSVSQSGLIRIRVKDEEPDEAVGIARFYISGLDTLVHFLQFTRAEHTMEFISKQIERYKDQLRRVREEISAFQVQHGVIDFDEQVRGAVDVAANLKISAVLAEIERDLLKEFATEDAMELKRKDAEYQNLIAQLERVMEGDTTESVFIPLKLLPELYQQYAALQRDLEVNERVYSFLLERYEESGIDRARSTPSVQVVDDPRLPEKPSGMPRWAFIFIITAFGFVWTSGVVAWWGWVRSREKSVEEETAYREIGVIVREDFQKLRRLLRL